MDRLFAKVPVKIIVDDFLIHGGNQRGLDDRMIAVLKRGREIGLKFNTHKAKLRVPEVSYVGHLSTADGLKPDPEKVKSINEIPAPADKDGILHFVGAVNYLDKFIEHKADLQGPILQLTRNDAAFVYGIHRNSRHSTSSSQSLLLGPFQPILTARKTECSMSMQVAGRKTRSIWLENTITC